MKKRILTKIVVCFTIIFFLVEAIPISIVFANNQEVVFKYGIDSEEVKQIQEKLAALGYYRGNISGRYREGTRNAVEQFQEDYGLEITGEVGNRLLEMIYKASYKTLKKKDRGEKVENLQRRLTELGYYHGKISGNFLEGTYSGIRDFQKKNQLDITGVADIKTLTLLYSPQALSKTQLIFDDSIEEEYGANDIIIEVEKNEEKSEEHTAFPYKRLLQFNATGEDVLAVQTKLQKLGYYKGDLSGGFYKQTKAAVKSFQKNNGLSDDGIIGKETWNRLFNSSEALGVQATPRPTPSPPPPLYEVLVDVENQVVTVFALDEKNHYRKTVKQMICSTGTSNAPSDVGDWILNGRTARWAYFPKWGSHAQYWTRINSSIAFHSVIYHSVNTMDLSVKSYTRLGKRASHGCIRLLVEDAKWIYDNLGKGITVKVVEGLPPDPELVASLKPPPIDKTNMLPMVTTQPTPEPFFDKNTPPKGEMRNLKREMEGEDVYWLQSKLKELGYYQGTITGVYLDGTREAVKEYQKAKGINPDGIAGKKTLEELYSNLSTPTPIMIPVPTNPPSIPFP